MASSLCIARIRSRPVVDFEKARGVAKNTICVSKWFTKHPFCSSCSTGRPGEGAARAFEDLLWISSDVTRTFLAAHSLRSLSHRIDFSRGFRRMRDGGLCDDRRRGTGCDQESHDHMYVCIPLRKATIQVWRSAICTRRTKISLLVILSHLLEYLGPDYCRQPPSAKHGHLSFSRHPWDVSASYPHSLAGDASQVEGLGGRRARIGSGREEDYILKRRQDLPYCWETHLMLILAQVSSHMILQLMTVSLTPTKQAYPNSEKYEMAVAAA